MSSAVTVDEAFGPTLEQVILSALEAARRPARSAVCPVCGGTMRRLADATVASHVTDLICGECGSSIEDQEPPLGQLRLVA